MCAENRNTNLWPKSWTCKLLITKALIDMVPTEKDQRNFNKDNESAQERYVKMHYLVGEVRRRQ